MRRALLLATALALSCLIAGCGERNELGAVAPARPITVALSGGASGIYAPLWGAIAAGDFKLGDLSVTIATTPNPLGLLRSGGAGFAIAPEDALLSARESGAQLIAIGALLQSTPAIPHGGSDAAVAALQAANATLTAHGTPPTYSPLVIVVPLFRAHYDGALLRAFLQSLMRGAQWAQSNPAAAATAIVNADHGLTQRFELALTRSAMSVAYPTQGGVPYGFQQDAAWETFGNWMHSQGLLSSPPSAGNAITDEFLPGEGD